MGCCGSSCSSSVDDWEAPIGTPHSSFRVPNSPSDKKELLSARSASPTPSSRSWAVASEMADLRCISPTDKVEEAVEPPIMATAAIQMQGARTPVDPRALIQTEVTVGSDWCTSFGTAEQTSVIECSCSETASCSSITTYAASCPSPASTTSSWDHVPEA